ncbi:uncharacterized protein LOC131414636 [Diceros bicornis minor]|uniref:uncharacterized protein LOC131414636 n=1 Tax=Diceros bicornis minor TaxID=77932 RepID=UPI0026EB3C67|nr:uncharacterized protein LOC131414636 [Diceros bicornis minor]
MSMYHHTTVRIALESTHDKQPRDNGNTALRSPASQHAAWLLGAFFVGNVGRRPRRDPPWGAAAKTRPLQRASGLRRGAGTQGAGAERCRSLAQSPRDHAPPWRAQPTVYFRTAVPHFPIGQCWAVECCAETAPAPSDPRGPARSARLKSLRAEGAAAERVSACPGSGELGFRAGGPPRVEAEEEKTALGASSPEHRQAYRLAKSWTPVEASCLPLNLKQSEMTTNVCSLIPIVD